MASDCTSKLNTDWANISLASWQATSCTRFKVVKSESKVFLSTSDGQFRLGSYYLTFSTSLGFITQKLLVRFTYQSIAKLAHVPFAGSSLHVTTWNLVESFGDFSPTHSGNRYQRCAWVSTWSISSTSWWHTSTRRSYDGLTRGGRFTSTLLMLSFLSCSVDFSISQLKLQRVELLICFGTRKSEKSIKFNSHNHSLL